MTKMDAISTASMDKSMRRYMNRFAICIIIAALIVAATPIDAHAASKNAKAHNAYLKAMRSGKIEAYEESALGYNVVHPYAYCDINRDGADELILNNDLGYDIWTYYKGKVKKVMSKISVGVISMRIYPKTRTVLFKVVETGMHREFDEYCKISKGNEKLVASYYHEWGYPGTDSEDLDEKTYSKNGKKVSKAVYDKYTKSLRKGKVRKDSKLGWGGFYTNNGIWGKFYDDLSAKKNKTYYIAIRVSRTSKYAFSIVPDGSDTITAKTQLCNSKKKTLTKATKKVFSHDLKKNTTYYLKVKVRNKKGKYSTAYTTNFNVYLSTDDADQFANSCLSGSY